MMRPMFSNGRSQVRGGFSQAGFDVGDHLLDGIEIRRVGWQVSRPGPVHLDHLAHVSGAAMRFDARDPDGLIDGKPALSFAEGASGKAPLLDDSQRRALAAMVTERANRGVVTRVVRWRLVDLAAYRLDEFALSLSRQGAVRLTYPAREGPDPTPTFIRRRSPPPMFDAPPLGRRAGWGGRLGAVGR
jgi:hypothetical protein